MVFVENITSYCKKIIWNPIVFRIKGTWLGLIAPIQNFHLQPICLEQSGELGSIENGIQKKDQFYIYFDAKNYFEIMSLWKCFGYFGSSYISQFITISYSWRKFGEEFSNMITY